MQKKFLSIIIPVYNAEKFLTECLDSCINQDVDHSEYEIICVDDGSTDNSAEMLKDYEERYQNIKVFTQANSGVSVARNLAIKNASGKYIWFVDSDDFIAPNCLKELKTLGELDYDLIDFCAFKFKEELTENQKVLAQQGKLLANKGYWGFACTHLFKNSIIKENNLVINQKIKYGEDEMFYAMFYEHVNSIINLNKAFYLYRGHEASVMNKVNLYENKIRRMNDVIYSMAILKQGLERGEFTKKIAKLLLEYRFCLAQQCLAELKKQDCKELIHQMKQQNLFQQSGVVEIPKFKIWERAIIKEYKSIRRNINPNFYDKLIWFIKAKIGK